MMPSTVNLVPKIEDRRKIAIRILFAVMPEMIFGLDDCYRKNTAEQRISRQIEMRVTPKINQNAKS